MRYLPEVILSQPLKDNSLNASVLVNLIAMKLPSILISFLAHQSHMLNSTLDYAKILLVLTLSHVQLVSAMISAQMIVNLEHQEM